MGPGHETDDAIRPTIPHFSEWPELAGVVVAVNGQPGRQVFPAFRSAEPPDVSYVEIGAVAQPFTARGP